MAKLSKQQRFRLQVISLFLALALPFALYVSLQAGLAVLAGAAFAGIVISMGIAIFA